MKGDKKKKVREDMPEYVDVDIGAIIDAARVINLYGFNSTERLNALLKFIATAIEQKGNSVAVIDTSGISKKEEIEGKIGTVLSAYHQIDSAEDQILILEKLLMTVMTGKHYDVVAIYDFSIPFTKYYKKIGQYWERDDMLEHQINTINDLANSVGVIICTNEAVGQITYPSNLRTEHSWGNGKLRYLFDKQCYVKGDRITTYNLVCQQ